MKFIVASANPDKAREIVGIIGDAYELIPRPASIPDVDETGETLEDNARLKAAALVDATGEAAIADDTGLAVDALDGMPGVRTSRYSGENATYAENVAKLLAELDGVPSDRRTARFISVVIAKFPDGSEVVAEGVMPGRIATERRGDNGFGYDPVFIPDEGDGRTFAEMASDEKHRFSHRGRALRALMQRLSDSPPA